MAIIYYPKYIVYMLRYEDYR